jgi:hypothetical protein
MDTKNYKKVIDKINNKNKRKSKIDLEINNNLECLEFLNKEIKYMNEKLLLIEKQKNNINNVLIELFIKFITNRKKKFLLYVEMIKNIPEQYKYLCSDGDILKKSYIYMYDKILKYKCVGKHINNNNCPNNINYDINNIEKLDKFGKLSLKEIKICCDKHIYMKDFDDYQYNTYELCSICKKFSKLFENQGICCECKKNPNYQDKFIEKKIAIDNQKICVGCRKSKNKENFIDKNKERIRCDTCREYDRARDAKRREQRKEYREKNKEKTALYSIKFRGRQLKILGHDNFRKLHAEQAANWRNNNPERQQEIHENNYYNYKLRYYKRRAFESGIEWNLSDAEAIEFFDKKCHYCDEKDIKGIINKKECCGIDRIDNKQGYILENCCSCCEICNVIKGSLDLDVFLQNIINILTYNKKIKKNICYDSNYKIYSITSYETYKNNSINNRKIDFELSEDEYNELKKEPCYLCGIPYEYKRHINGIDRINSDIGYIIDNCKACCYSCNYMKNNYDYDIFINKLLKIYEKHKEYKIDNNFINKNKIHKLININKITKDEKNIIKMKKNEIANSNIYNKYNIND